MYLLVHKSGVITLQTSGTVDYRVATVRHRDTADDRAAVAPTHPLSIRGQPLMKLI